MPDYDVVVIGGGPAGLQAAIYAASENLKTLLVNKGKWGGQARHSCRLENVFGFEDITGKQLTKNSLAQCERFGVEKSEDGIIRVSRSDKFNQFWVQDEKSLVRGVSTVIYAGGLEYKELDVPGLDKELGKRVHYLSTLKDGPRNAGKDVAIIGGGNSAAQCALHICKYARLVRMIVKHGDLREKMSDYLVDRIEETPNIEVLCGRDLIEIDGEVEQLMKLRLKGATHTAHIYVHACHIFIGGKPNTECLGSLVERDAGGFLIDFKEEAISQTITPGLFVCGDCVSGQFKSIATAVGSAREAVARCNEFLGRKKYG